MATMDSQNLFFIAENFSFRINLLATALISNTYLSYSYAGGLAGFIFYFLYYVLIEAFFVALAVGAFSAYMFFMSQRDASASVDNSKWFTFNNVELEREFKGKKMPMETFVEAYIAQEISLVEGVDYYDMLGHRDELFRFNFTKGHVNFFFQQFLSQTFMHTQQWDQWDVSKTYNMGNDFYNWFLGERMVYTSGIFDSLEDSLEQAQDNKMDMVCHKLELQPGEKHLDIGCGWGTFVRHCAKNFGTNSYGVTIAQEQINWHNEQKISEGLDSDVASRAKCELKDYREVAGQKFDKISALEMAEHVGIKNYKAFCRQVYDMLEDDGFFYIQVCGLRGSPSWHFEDLIWGLFMAKYIFPGADASCPVHWVLTQLEAAGFEIHNVENVSIHYCETIFRWYQNWLSNRSKIVDAYDERLFRLWEVFLAWSVRIGRQGTSACFQVLCHKNRNEFEREQYLGNDLANHLLKAKRA